MPPPKKKKIEEVPNDIPEILQGEIARLDQRFKVNVFDFSPQCDFTYTFIPNNKTFLVLYY